MRPGDCQEAQGRRNGWEKTTGFVAMQCWKSGSRWWAGIGCMAGSKLGDARKEAKGKGRKKMV